MPAASHCCEWRQRPRTGIDCIQLLVLAQPLIVVPGKEQLVSGPVAERFAIGMMRDSKRLSAAGGDDVQILAAVVVAGECDV